MKEPEFVKRYLKHSALQKIRQYDKALEISTAIEKEEPQRSAELKELAEELLGEGIDLYEEYTEVNPTDDDALAGFGGALRRKGDLRGAAEKYRMALEVNPDSSYAAVNLVGLYALLGDEAEADFTEYRPKAIKLTQEIIDQEKDDHWTWYDAATLQLLDGNIDKAIENLELAIAKTMASKHFVSVISNLNTLRKHRPQMRAGIDEMLELIRIRREEKEV